MATQLQSKAPATHPSVLTYDEALRHFQKEIDNVPDNQDFDFLLGYFKYGTIMFDVDSGTIYPRIDTTSLHDTEKLRELFGCHIPNVVTRMRRQGKKLEELCEISWGTVYITLTSEFEVDPFCNQQQCHDYDDYDIW